MATPLIVALVIALVLLGVSGFISWQIDRVERDMDDWGDDQ